MFWFLYGLIYLPVKIIAPFKIIGKENYNKKKNYVVVCNHQSAFDPIILDFALHRKNRFIAKKNFLKRKATHICLKMFWVQYQLTEKRGLQSLNLKK